MDCLTDATTAVANDPHLSDAQKVAKVVELIAIVGNGLSLADVRGLIDEGLADCKKELTAEARQRAEQLALQLEV